MTTNDPVPRLLCALGHAGPASSDFDLNPSVSLPEGRKLRPAAVLVPVLVAGGAPRVILTKRASGLKHHPGQIAFPGGKVDDTDAGHEAAALREAREEIGLPGGAVEVLGALPEHETVTGFAVSPFVGVLREAVPLHPEPGETEEVFTVPLDHVTDPARYFVRYRYWRGQRRFYYTVPWGPYYIWGATARILRGLAERWQQWPG